MKTEAQINALLPDAAFCKACADCGDPKPLTDFYRYPRNLDGRHSVCKACMKARSKRQYAGRTKPEPPPRQVGRFVGWWDREPRTSAEYVAEMGRRRELNARRGSQRTCLDCPTRLRKTRPPGDTRCDGCERKRKEAAERTEAA